MKTRPRIVLLNPTCLDVLAPLRGWIDSLGVEFVAEESIRTLHDGDVDRVFAGADALIVPAIIRTLPHAEHMERHKSLKVLSIAANGYDWLDVAVATRHGIVVTNAPAREGIEVVADLAFGLMLAVARQIPHRNRLVQAGVSERGIGTMLWGKTLGIIGLGNIGKAVARRARGFEMKVLAASRTPDTTFARDHGIEIVSLEELLRRADFVSLHVRLDDSTRGMIGRRELGLMKPTAFLVNTARDTLVDEAAMETAVLNGKIAGVAMDDPPSKKDSPLLKLPNFVCTPHIGNRAREGMEAVLRLAVENAVKILRGERPQYVVNPEVFEAAHLRVPKVGQASRLSPAFAMDRQDACPTFHPFDPNAPIGISSRHLPHWRQKSRTYFVTFRLNDSIPQDKLKAWKQERDIWLCEHPEPHSIDDLREYHERFSERLHAWLDAGIGSCLLRNPRAAGRVEGALRFFDGKRYQLGDFVIMPNHVHVLVTPRGEFTLSQVLHSWKSYSAKEVNKELKREGKVWQNESFDHIVRSSGQLEKFQHYIRDNPTRAGLRSDEYRIGTS